MKKFILLLVVVMSTAASAQTYHYHCVQKQWDQQMDIKVTSKTMTILNETEQNGSSKIGNLGFTNEGPTGGNGKMKDYLYFSWSKAKSTIFNYTETQHYYVQPALITGGVKLNNGSKGGFVTYEGQGYSYESYVCFLK